MSISVKYFFLVQVPKAIPRSWKKNYWTLLSNVDIASTFPKIKAVTEIGDNIPCTHIEFSDGDGIYVQNSNRASRFLRGTNYAFARIWKIYIGQFTLDFQKFCNYPIFDIGANVGEFSFASAQRGSRKIYAIEPDYRISSVLKRNIFSRNLEKIITVLPIAVGDRSEIREFYISSDESDSSLMRPTDFSEVTTVRVKTFDQIVEELGITGNIGIVKMDCEGFEPEVLEGMTKSFNRIGLIAVDTSPERIGNSTSVQILQRLEGVGFDVQISSQINNREIVLAINRKFYERG